MQAEEANQVIAFADWLWLNYICFYGEGSGQWLGHDETGPCTTEELYKKWSANFQRAAANRGALPNSVH